MSRPVEVRLDTEEDEELLEAIQGLVKCFDAAGYDGRRVQLHFIHIGLKAYMSINIKDWTEDDWRTFCMGVGDAMEETLRRRNERN